MHVSDGGEATRKMTGLRENDVSQHNIISIIAMTDTGEKKDGL